MTGTAMRDVTNTAKDLVTRLARPEILALTPYSSARREVSGGEIWLNANESPWNNTDEPGVNRYPDCQPPELRQAYADYAGLSPEQVLITRGADEGIELLIRAFCRPGQDRIATLAPSYGMYAISAETNGVECQTINWAEDYGLPEDFSEQCQAGEQAAKLVFVCNPNNPTGTVLETEQLLALAKRLPDSLLVVDEAYIEFCPDYSVEQAIADTPNLVVLRTLSKAFALAGARCGFTLAQPAVIQLLEKVIAPYPVPVPVARLAQDCLSETGLATMASQVQQLNDNRQALAQTLAANDAVSTVLPSQANFLLCRVESAAEIQQALVEQGILVRRYGGQLANWLRFSIADDSQQQRLLDALLPLLSAKKPCSKERA